MENLDEFTTSYIETAIWSSSDDEGNSLESGGYDAGDLAPSALDELTKECAAFQDSPAWKAALAAHDAGEEVCAQSSLAVMGGHDFWLTQNGHGAGFWDGGWLEPHGAALDKEAKAYGSIDLYLGDDGLIYTA